jgi:hypothetical protein
MKLVAPRQPKESVIMRSDKEGDAIIQRVLCSSSRAVGKGCVIDWAVQNIILPFYLIPRQRIPWARSQLLEVVDGFNPGHWQFNFSKLQSSLKARDPNCPRETERPVALERLPYRLIQQSTPPDNCSIPIIKSKSILPILFGGILLILCSTQDGRGSHGD